MKKNYFKILLICALSITLANCDGEDGANGLDGTNGINGENGVDGVNGENGTDGENGEGFDEATKNGNITVNLEGTRIDGVNFTSENDFKFFELDNVSGSLVTKNANSLRFSILRKAGLNRRANWVYINLEVNDPGTTNQNLEGFYIEMQNTVYTNDNKVFSIYDEYTEYSSSVTNFVISDYSFDNETNNLKFSYAFDVAANSNSTRNDLSISGTVNVIVFEEINVPI